jgi:hypothetical protein
MQRIIESVKGDVTSVQIVEVTEIFRICDERNLPRSRRKKAAELANNGYFIAFMIQPDAH